MSSDHGTAKAESAAKLSRADAKLNRCRDRGDVRLSDLEMVRNDLAELVAEHGAALDELEKLRARRSTPPLATVSGVCTCSTCEATGRFIYRMIGKCLNCTSGPILMLFRTGDGIRPLECPFCGCGKVVAGCRAADDEIPTAAEDVVLDARDAKAPIKRTPEQWCEQYGVDIADPDGWRSKDAPAWDEPIALADFLQRARQSTARNVPDVDWQRLARDAKAAER